MGTGKAPALRPGARREGRRDRGRPARRIVALAERSGVDLLALTILALVLVAALLYAALLPPAPLAFAVDQPPTGVVLRGFYGPERNAAGPYRWAKPDASLGIYVGVPATYRVVLGLADDPAARAIRPAGVTVFINGRRVGAAIPEVGVRDYAFEGELVKLRLEMHHGFAAKMRHRFAAGPHRQGGAATPSLGRSA